MKINLTSLICVALSLGITSLNGQTFEWARSWGGADVDIGTSIATDASGSIFISGFFSGTVDFDPGPDTFNLTTVGIFGGDIFVQKLDPSGNFLWARSWASGSSISPKITIDDFGNVYTSGCFSGTVDFDPGPDTTNLTTGNQPGIFIQKMDASGSFLWAKSFGGASGGYDVPSSIIVGASGVYTTGVYSYVEDFDPGPDTSLLSSTQWNEDIFVQKLDTLGNFLWAKSLGGPLTDECYSICIDDLDNVYITGYFKGTADFDPGPGIFNLTSVSGSQDVFVYKMDASGNFLWTKSFGGVRNGDSGLSISVDAAGNVYTSGQFYDSVDFNPGPGVYNLSSNGIYKRDVFIQKMDASGNFLWAKSYGNTNWNEVASFSLAVDDFGNVFIAGDFIGTVDFDLGLGTYNLSEPLGGFFVQKLDPLGSFIWAKSLGGPIVRTSGVGWGNWICIDAMDNVLTTGFFQGTVNFDPDSGTANLTSVGDQDIFVLKLADSSSFQTLAGNIADAKYESQTLTYPPLANVLVKLLDDQGFLLDSTFSDLDGAFSFDSISSEADHVIAMYVSPSGDTFEVAHSLAGSTGQLDFIIPASIANSVSALMPGLEHFSFSMSAIGENVTIDGYDLQTLQALLLDAQHIEGNDVAVAQTLGRMLIMEIALGRYFTNANLLLEERQLAIRDFSLFFASMFNVYEGLALLPNTSAFNKLIANHLLGLLGNSIRRLSQFTLSAVPGKEGQATRAYIEEAIDYITLIAIEGGYAEAVVRAASEEYIIREPMKRKIQGKYLDVTQEPLDITLLQGLSYPVVDGFDAAHQIMQSRTAAAQNRMVTGIQVSTFARGIGNMESQAYELFEFTFDLTAILNQNGDLGGILKTLGKYSKVLTITRAVGLLSALAATDAYFKINRNDVFRDIEEVLLWQAPPNPGSGVPIILDDGSGNLDSCVNVYITTLRQIETFIQSGQYTQAESEILVLLAVDSCVSSILENKLPPIMAANEVLADSVSGYGDLFIADMAVPIMEADFLRFKALHLCLAFSVDSLKSGYADSIKWVTDTLELKWAAATPKVDSAYAVASQIASPAYILPVEANFPDTLAPGASALVKVVFYNAGNSPAEQLQVDILTREGLVADPGMIFIGSLPPGAKDSILFEFEAPLADVLAGYQVLFSSENTNAGGIGGALIVGNPNFSSGIENKTPYSPLTIIPNPFSESTTIQFESRQVGEWKMTLFSLNGQIVYEEELDIATPGQQNIRFSDEGLSQGMYLVVLRAPGGELLRGKLLLSP